MAVRDVASIATLGKVWRGVLRDEVTGAKATLERWVMGVRSRRNGAHRGRA